jgi:hypothetical protein
MSVKNCVFDFRWDDATIGNTWRYEPLKVRKEILPHLINGHDHHVAVYMTYFCLRNSEPRNLPYISMSIDEIDTQQHVCKRPDVLTNGYLEFYTNPAVQLGKFIIPMESVWAGLYSSSSQSLREVIFREPMYIGTVRPEYTNLRHITLTLTDPTGRQPAYSDVDRVGTRLTFHLNFVKIPRPERSLSETRKSLLFEHVWEPGDYSSYRTELPVGNYSNLLGSGATDTLDGSVYIMFESRYRGSRTTTCTKWTGYIGVTGRYVTPLIFEISGNNRETTRCVLKGIGTSRTHGSTGTYTWDFGVQLGSNELKNNYVLGFTDFRLENWTGSAWTTKTANKGSIVWQNRVSEHNWTFVGWDYVTRWSLNLNIDGGLGSIVGSRALTDTYVAGVWGWPNPWLIREYSVYFWFDNSMSSNIAWLTPLSITKTIDPVIYVGKKCRVDVEFVAFRGTVTWLDSVGRISGYHPFFMLRSPQITGLNSVTPAGQETITNGMEISRAAAIINYPEGNRAYSSIYSNDLPGTGYARSMLDSAQAWSAIGASVGQWMRIDLNTETAVYGVQTQGRNGSNQWVTSYKLYYSNDDVTYYEVEGGKSFTGNTNQSTKVTQNLNTPIKARYIKFHILAWSGWISMRASVITVHTDQAQDIGDFVIPIDHRRWGKANENPGLYIERYEPQKLWGYVSETVGERLSRMEITVDIDSWLGRSNPFWHTQNDHGYMGVRLTFNIEEW